MRNDIKQPWIEDLESGKYQQCQGLLCITHYDGNGEAHCCLGVLIYRTMPRLGIKLSDKWGFEMSIESMSDGEELSRYFREAIGLSIKDMSTLIQMNDGDKIVGDDGENIDIEPKTFAEIAQWLRDHEEV